jgi:hypothetical protein
MMWISFVCSLPPLFFLGKMKMASLQAGRETELKLFMPQLGGGDKREGWTWNLGNYVLNSSQIEKKEHF